ncbi:MAG TPA: GTP 3',8-cyclase MoaA [Dehalococcoidia bacterium]|nr:GTP 3',8-cyclase MoaA [Dehalococcoidia bacterium]
MKLRTGPEMTSGAPLDAHQRRITYLRVSVTDRCNLRCVYCMPEGGIDLVPMEDVLSYEEVRDIVQVAASMGLRRVRLTGGEPLARKGLVDLVGMISGLAGIEEVALSTNGIALARHAESLAKAGLSRVNVSLDTLRTGRFRRITRGGRLRDVLEGIDAARAAGLTPVKLNVVVMRGLNDDEVVDFAHSTLDNDWQVRFIELMPFMALENTGQQPAQSTAFVSNEAVRRQIESTLGPLEPDSSDGNGPARYYRLPAAKGKVGFISPLTEQGFCERCNRMRLTATGKLRPCLLTDHEIDLRAAMRGGEGEGGIRRGIMAALESKPDAHHLGDGNRPRRRRMVQIGG